LQITVFAYEFVIPRFPLNKVAAARAAEELAMTKTSIIS